MTDPKYAVKHPGIGRYYHLPTGEQLVSITNVLDTCVSKPALPPSAAKYTAAKAWELLPQMVAASRKPKRREELNREIKGHYRHLWEKARELGTRTHVIAEARVLGKPFAEDPEAEPLADQVLRFFEDFGVDYETDVEATEATVINRTHGYAGTGDLWLWLRWPGEKRRQLTLLDYKTSQSRPVESVYPEMGMQVAALVNGERLLLDDGTEVDPPGPVERTAILNLRKSSYALMEMPLVGTIDDAFAGFVSLIPGALYLHSAYGAKPLPITKPRLKAVS